MSNVNSLEVGKRRGQRNTTPQELKFGISESQRAVSGQQAGQSVQEGQSKRARSQSAELWRSKEAVLRPFRP